MIAFTILTGARDRAISSFKLKHVDVKQRCVIQDAREVETKFSKTFNTYFFPVGEEVEKIVCEWVEYLEVEKLWGLDDPLFPSTKMEIGDDQLFRAGGIERAHWGDAGPIRRIFRSSFQKAGLPYYNPHSFRNTLARLAGMVCSTPEQYKAWSQNLGHEKPLTTLLSYGYVEDYRQGELIAQLGSKQLNKVGSKEDLMNRFAAMLDQN